MWTAGFPEPLTFSLRARRMLRARRGHYDVVHDNQTLGYGLLGSVPARPSAGDHRAPPGPDRPRPRVAACHRLAAALAATVVRVHPHAAPGGPSAPGRASPCRSRRGTRSSSISTCPTTASGRADRHRHRLFSPDPAVAEGARARRHHGQRRCAVSKACDPWSRRSPRCAPNATVRAGRGRPTTAGGPVAALVERYDSRTRSASPAGSVRRRTRRPPAQRGAGRRTLPVRGLLAPGGGGDGLRQRRWSPRPPGRCPKSPARTARRPVGATRRCAGAGRARSPRLLDDPPQRARLGAAGARAGADANSPGGPRPNRRSTATAPRSVAP